MTRDEMLAELSDSVGRGGLYAHDRTERRYRMLGICKIKQVDGSWVDGVLYSPDSTLAVTYVREVADFYEAFTYCGDDK